MRRTQLALPFLFTSLAFAQTLVVPTAAAAAEGNANNAFPWNRGAQSQRVQFCYDSSHFTTAMPTPQAITRLRWRADAAAATSTWPGGSWPNVRIDMSTSASDYLALSTTFASNHGSDQVTVHQGAVTVLAGAGNGVGVPGVFYIDVLLTAPFVYNPALGDLLIDIMLDGTGWTGTSWQCDHHSGVGTGASRIFSAVASPTATSGTIGTEYAAVMEVTHAPAVGLFPGFSATPRTGASPLLVQFNDRSYTSHTSGVVAWAWDVDGDSVTDYTTQNPSHTYATCGSYTVSLSVIDGNGPGAVTRTNFIVTDDVTPSFTTANLGSNTIQFTDTSVPTPTSWAWDLDGDGITDSTVQNPVRVYGAGCAAARVTLTVNRLCRGPFSTSGNVIFAPNTVAYMTGSTSTSSTTVLGPLFDVQVTNPMGVTICAVTVRPAGVTSTFNMEVYVTPNTYLGNDLNAAVWRRAGTGVGNTANPNTVAINPPLYLPQGNFGMAIFIGQTGGTSTSISYQSISATAPHPGAIVTPDITLFPNSATAPGMIRTGLFGGGLLNPRVPNVTLHYGTCNGTGDAGYGFFGPGCAGTLGIPGNVASPMPRLNSTTTLQFNRLQANAMFLLIGFSNTMSPFGPLPVNMAPFGAAGCFGRVSPDSTVLLIGSGNLASFNLGIPNSAVLLCQQFYSQGLSLDPAVNALGFVATDAAAGIVGQ